jgi:glycosyltransferase involved in cell wall biosynthesis
MSWTKFSRYQQQRRIHIGLAPLLDTPFNRGKSHIKFLDIAAMGGVGIYSDRSPYSELVEHGVDGLLVGDRLEDWYQSICYLIDNPEDAKQMALAAAEKATRVGSLDSAKRFWERRSVIR